MGPSAASEVAVPLRARVPPIVVLVALISGLLWMSATPASAHYVGSTVIEVSGVAGTGRPTIELDVQVPLQNIDFAYGTDLDSDPAGAVARHDDWLRSLIIRRIALVSPDGAAWTVTIETMAGAVLAPENVLHLRMTAVAPSDTHPDLVELRWAVVSDVVYSDKAFVSGRSSSGSVELAGVLTHQRPALRLTVQAPDAARVSFGHMLGVGANHFREGVDHQLFLCVLAIGAARRRAPLLSRARRLAVLTLCFTLGHSVSLAVATLGDVSLPSRWVETGIAATIVFAAVQTVRPLLGERAELILTIAFGLIHGFGFAGTLRDLSLRGADLAFPLLEFNLGLELAQLAALMLMAVPILLISRSTPTTYAVTASIAIIAASWIVQRALGVQNPIDHVANAVLATPERLALILLVAGVLRRVEAFRPSACRPGQAQRAARIVSAWVDRSLSR